MTKTDRTPNRLIHSASPYLLQHAHNPVDWFEWGKEALDKAKKEDKPLLVSIGYSSCHWCHVMERESFEKDEIAEVMNKYFVCIKVDREERPDIDQIYMDAVQALGVNGGWPLNVFLTPDQKPFFGGTYFSPGGWVQILENINKAFLVNRGPIEETAEQLRIHLTRSDVERFRKQSANTALSSDLETIYKKFDLLFDTTWGGMDKAPKFIMPSVWHWLLRYHYLTKDQNAIDQVMLTLKRIGMGGIYDQIGGGFSRYSVDGHWFVPHFEKMLYDNAQLISLYSEAYAVSHDVEFKTIVYETVEWLKREMMHSSGGFYSAIDADSEGVEGKFYVWTSGEMELILGNDAGAISEYYSVVRKGNWEHGNNILIRNKEDNEFANDKKITLEEWRSSVTEVKAKLLRHRDQRIRPGLDDKIITSWNGITICGLVDAYKAFGETGFLALAVRCMQFIETDLKEGNILYRSFKNKRSSVTAFLDDYAYVIQAYINLYEVTFDESWLKKADRLAQYVVEIFSDTDGYFHYAAQGAEKLIASKKEIFDNVIPSSNAIMARNLFALGTMLEKQEWKKRAIEMVEPLGDLIKGEPNYMSQWAIVYTEIKREKAEVVFAGQGRHAERRIFQRYFHPFAFCFGKENDSALDILQGKAGPEEETTIYVCYDRACKKPVHSAKDAMPDADRTLSTAR